MRHDKEELAKIFWKSRKDAGKTQEYIANEMGISRHTIVNWENGISSPTLWQMSEWFDVLGLNPLSYVYDYMYPSADNDPKSDADEIIVNTLNEIIESQTIDDKKALLYILYGKHGSPSHAILQLFLAYLHLPIRERLSRAALVYESYLMHEQLDEIINKEYIKPNTDELQKAILKAKISVLERKSGYIT